MGDTQLKIDLDPKKVITALNDMSDEMKALAKTVEESLGKEAPANLKKLEEAAAKGSSNIAAYFRDLGKRVKEDLKTAFDFGGLMAGLKMGKELGEGVKSVFDLERAFDRLNTRLQLTGQTFNNFKKMVGEKVAATGQKLEDVMPGIETASAKGGVKSPEQLSNIGEALGRVRAATGESTDALADSVVEILKTQGKKVTGASFQQTLDALQATRVTGAFKNATEAGQAIEQLSPYGKQMHLNTREMGGLAATASRAGSSGQDILRQLMERASQPGQMQALNSIFGQQIFRNGKLDASALGKIDTKRFGEFSPQIMEQATGLHGASGADLTRFVDAFKNNMGDFNKVVKGSNETASQFNAATDNLASGLDKFREKTKNAGREIGEGLSSAAHALLKGDFKGAASSAASAGESAWHNKGTVGAALGMTAGAAILAGRGAKGLLSKVPGVGGLAGGLVGAEAAKAAGVQPVYVVNASEIGGGGAAGALGKLGKFAIGGGLATGGAVAAAAGLGGVLGYGAVKGLDHVTGGGYSNIVGKPGEWLADMFEDKSYLKNMPPAKTAKGGGNDHEAMATAVAKGVEQGMARANRGKQVQFSNPSRPTGSGGSL